MKCSFCWFFAGFLKLENTLKVTKDVFEKFTKKYTPQKNDILMSRVGTYGLVSFVNTDKPFCLGQNTLIINSPINYFIYCSLNLQSSKNQIEEKVGGSTQKTITLKDIRELLLIVPNEQKKIINFQNNIKPFFQKISYNHNSIDFLKKIKKILLPKLMSGEIRV